MTSVYPAAHSAGNDRDTIRSRFGMDDLVMLGYELTCFRKVLDIFATLRTGNILIAFVADDEINAFDIVTIGSGDSSTVDWHDVFLSTIWTRPRTQHADGSRGNH